jgi:hypothetical protein
MLSYYDPKKKKRHSSLLDADIKVSDDPRGNEDSKHSSSDGKGLAQAVPEGVIVSNLTFCQHVRRFVETTMG